MSANLIVKHLTNMMNKDFLRKPSSNSAEIPSVRAIFKKGKKIKDQLMI